MSNIYDTQAKVIAFLLYNVGARMEEGNQNAAAGFSASLEIVLSHFTGKDLSNASVSEIHEAAFAFLKANGMPVSAQEEKTLANMRVPEVVN